MKIFVDVNGVRIERELTDTELMEAWVEQQHLFDIDYIEGMFGMDERFDGMSVKEKNDALSDIAWRYDAKISGLDDPDKFEVASDALEDYFEERAKQKERDEMVKLESLIGYDGAKQIIDRFQFCGDWEIDDTNLTNALQRHYYDAVGIFNEGIRIAIDHKVSEVLIEKYPDKDFVVNPDGVLCEVYKENDGRYEIEVTIDVVGGDGKGLPFGEELSFKIVGNDLEEMKKGILPAVQKACAERGYLDNQVVVGVLIEENGEWLDSDEETFDLSELNVSICVYKDALGYNVNDGLYGGEDNLTGILVPKAWLWEKVKAEGVADFYVWYYEEYTADDTDAIARDAVSEGVILSCEDKRISCVLGLGESFLNVNDYGKTLAAKMREIYLSEYQKGEFVYFGTDIVPDDKVSSVEDAAGWCLLTYGDRALQEVQEWVDDNDRSIYGFYVEEVLGVLENCMELVKENSLESRLGDASLRSDTAQCQELGAKGQGKEPPEATF